MFKSNSKTKVSPAPKPVGEVSVKINDDEVLSREVYSSGTVYEIAADLCGLALQLWKALTSVSRVRVVYNRFEDDEFTEILTMLR